MSNINEFLGAENGFSELINLDTNNDNFVDSKELSKANIKIVKTDSKGNQSIEDVSEVLKNEDGIDLSSYEAKNNQLMDNGNFLQGIFEQDNSTRK